MKHNRKSLKNRVLVGLVLVFTFIMTSASSCDSDGNGVGDTADALRKAECAILDSAGSDFASGVCH